MPDTNPEHNTNPEIDADAPPPVPVGAVDDEAGICFLIEKSLAVLGYAPHTAEDADSGLELIREVRPKVVLSDIRMPGHDGVWLVQQIAEAFPGLPVVLVTAVPDLDGRLILQPAVAGYLVKPFSLEQLRAVLVNALALADREPPPRASTSTEFTDFFD